jgi:transposase InsO family protein
LSIPALITRVREQHGLGEELQLAPATVHRLLARAGLMRKDPGAAHSNDRRRFAFQHPGELWMSDVMHAPAVGYDGRQRRKTYLIAFIDDATRVVPYAAFAFKENTQAFLPVLKQALVRRGCPARLFVDNGANYRSRHLALVCAKLGIALIHSRPFQPQGKGKIERFFRTVRAQLIAHLEPEHTDNLDALNRRLWAYIEGEYHHTPHRGLDGQTPLERWSASAEQVRFIEPELDLDNLFLFEAQRRVNKDRTVSLNGVLYEVDAALVGDKVTLRFDPSAPPGRPVQVHHQGQLIESAKPLDAYANTRVKRIRPSNLIEAESPPPTPARGLALRQLRARDVQSQQRDGDDDDNGSTR